MKLPLDKDQRKFFSQAAGSAVASMRVSVGMTQDDVAEALGIGIDAVSRLERGVIELGVTRMVELCELFGCGMDELLLAASGRPSDQAMSIAQNIEVLPPKERDAVATIVRQLAELLRPKRPARQPG